MRAPLAQHRFSQGNFYFRKPLFLFFPVLFLQSQNRGNFFINQGRGEFAHPWQDVFSKNFHFGIRILCNLLYEIFNYRLKFLDYAPLVFLSAATGLGVEALFKKVELVARERRIRSIGFPEPPDRSGET